jgi:thiol-disulfide isomerase/thioredoxin
MKYTIALLIAFLVVSVGAQAKKYDPPLTGDMVKLETYPEPKYIPEVMLSRVPEGLSYLSEYKNSVILLNVWATWCPPCVEELPSLNALQTAMGNDDFKVVSVSLEQDTPDVVKKYLDDNKLTQLIPFVDANHDIQKLKLLKDVPGVPVSLLLDRQGRVVARYQGNADWNGRSARAVIEYYLKNLPPIGGNTD